MHLGLIGGIGPAATEFCYRLLARAHAAAGRRMELTIVNADARELIANMTAGAPDRQAEVFAGLTRRLAAARAPRRWRSRPCRATSARPSSCPAPRCPC
jgi:aspartate racemase